MAGNGSDIREATSQVPNGSANPTAQEPVGAQPASSDGKKAKKVSPKVFSRRQAVIGGVGVGVVGLIAGGVLAKWGVVEDAIAAGRVDLSATPTKLIVTDRARCSGCQRCEIACSLKNDGRASHASSRIHVWQNYNYGHGQDSGDGIYGNCEFTVEHCKQCKDAACVRACPVHAIAPDKESGARVIDPDKCIGCGACNAACPWHMPKLDPETNVSNKCIACGRCAEQCPNGAIKLVDWKDIAQEAIDQGLVSTWGLFSAEELDLTATEQSTNTPQEYEEKYLAAKAKAAEEAAKAEAEKAAQAEAAAAKDEGEALDAAEQEKADEEKDAAPKADAPKADDAPKDADKADGEEKAAGEKTAA